jgi:hypothetical protein
MKKHDYYAIGFGLFMLPFIIVFSGLRAVIDLAYSALESSSRSY